MNVLGTMQRVLAQKEDSKDDTRHDRILEEIRSGKHVWPEDDAPEVIRGEGFVLVKEKER
jgi:hypothetical protein